MAQPKSILRSSLNLISSVNHHPITIPYAKKLEPLQIRIVSVLEPSNVKIANKSCSSTSVSLNYPPMDPTLGPKAANSVYTSLNVPEILKVAK